jgi:hypothetical protein
VLASDALESAKPPVIIAIAIHQRPLNQGHLPLIGTAAWRGRILLFASVDCPRSIYTRTLTARRYCKQCRRSPHRPPLLIDVMFPHLDSIHCRPRYSLIKPLIRPQIELIIAFKGPENKTNAEPARGSSFSHFPSRHSSSINANNYSS